jgi:hypothetical protein
MPYYSPSTFATFEISIGISLFTNPPSLFSSDGLTVFLATLQSFTITCFFDGITAKTSPVLPLSLYHHQR